MDTDSFSLLDFGCLTDRQFSEWIKHQIDQAFRILAPCSKPDIASAGLACGVIPSAHNSTPCRRETPWTVRVRQNLFFKAGPQPRFGEIRPPIERIPA